MIQKVLFVDDSNLMHSLIRLHFKDEAIELHSALSGEIALEMVHTLRPDLIVLDVDMPDMDGFEVCRLLQDDPRTMNIPVIFLTASRTICEKVLGLELGARDYICKPFHAEELVARVRASLRTKRKLDQLSNARVNEFLLTAAPRSMKLLPGVR